jgi:hypothetical protein
VIEYVRLLPQELRWREVVLDHGPGVQAGWCGYRQYTKQLNFQILYFFLLKSSYESQLRSLPQRKQEDRRNDIIDKFRANVPKPFSYLNE